jgi:divalent metal cation (Fe/Co/Zn/Cd) transporter
VTNKILWYVKRYGIAEIISVAIGLLSFAVARMFTDNEIICAYVITIFETLSFYGVIFLRDYRSKTKRSALKTFYHMIFEFGAAEVLDVLVTRPGIIALLLLFLGNSWLNALLGMILANLVFYSISAVSREIHLKHSK